MDLKLQGRTALIGGASSGLGRACAEALAAEGCRLAIWSRGEEGLRAVAAQELAPHPGVVQFNQHDARKQPSFQRAKPLKRILGYSRRCQGSIRFA